MDNVQIAKVLRARAEAIREADPYHRPIFAHKASPVIGSGQDWVYARCQDFVGSSAYPAWASRQSWDDRHPAVGQPRDRHSALLVEMWDNVALRYDYIRCCNPRGKPVWAAEFQGGPVSTGFHKGRVPSPDDIRRWMLTAVGSGVTAISFWVTRAEIHMAEQNGFSLLDSQGDTTPRYEEAARIGRALNAHADLFGQPTRPRSDVAIVINEWNYQLCSLLEQGYEHLPYSVRGWYRLLWDANVPVDFIEASELDEAYVGQYKALVLPFPLSLSEETAGKLARYVENSKHLQCGDGGITITNDDHLGARAALFVDKGCNWSEDRTVRLRYAFIAPCYRMTELQGAVLLAQLPRLPEIVARRQALGERLRQSLLGLAGITPPGRIEGSEHSYWSFPILVDEKALGVTASQFGEAVRVEGAPMGGNWLGKPLYLFEALSEQITFGRSRFPFRSPYARQPVRYGPGLCPRAEQMMAQLRTISINERYTEEDIDDIARAVRKVAEEYARRC